MDSKSEMFDLKREKRELDAFLSTIEEAEPSLPLTPKEIMPKKETASTVDVFRPESSGLKTEAPAGTSDNMFGSAMQKVKSDMSNVNEFIPRSTGTVSLDLTEKESVRGEKGSAFMSLEEDRKTETLQRVTIPQGVKPLESFKTMTRFDGTTKSAEDELAQVTLSDHQKVSPVTESDKKKDKTAASSYDFTPEKKGMGKGKWIWIILLLILLLVAGYFWVSSKTSITRPWSFFKTDGDVAAVSVDEIKLQNVRQRLVYNVKMGKSIRVIEGIAENAATHPVSRIKIAAHLYNTEGAILATKESYGGHILIDSKLESLDAAGLMAELNKGKASYSVIPPKGQVPFMIIFAEDVAGVHKLSVVAVDFEK